MTENSLFPDRKPNQLPLDLSFAPSFGRDSFVEGDSNRVAVAWIDKYPDWPAPMAVLCGPEGSGKSHLLTIWAREAKAHFLNGQDLTVEGLDQQLGDASIVALDNALACREPDALFHLINILKERQGTLLIATSQPPARWQIGPKDLISRVSAMPLLSLGAPDDSILRGILLKHFEDRRLVLSMDVVRYLQDRMPRSFEAAAKVARTLDKMSLADKRATITLPLARRALERLGYT